MQEVAVLGSLFCAGKERAFQMDAHQLCTAAVFLLMGCGILTDQGKLVLAQGHSCRADIRHALGQLIICHGLKSLRSRIAEILADASMEMNVHQARDHIAAGGIHSFPVAAGPRKYRAVCAKILFTKTVFQVEHASAGYPHISTPVPSSLERAASSHTRTTSGWSWRIEAGHSGVMGPHTVL